MGYVLRRIEIYPRVGNGWSTTPRVLTEASFPDLRLGWGKIKDSFSFTLPAARQYFELQALDYESLVRIFVWRDRLAYNPQTDLLMEGVIADLPQTVSDKGNVVTVRGFNFSEVFFDNLIPLSQENVTFIEMARAVIEFLNGGGVNARAIRRAYWHPSNPVRKSDGTAFPTKTLILNWTSAANIMEKLMTEEFTEDGQYLWYFEQYKALLGGSINASDTSVTLAPLAGGGSVATELPDTGQFYVDSELIEWTSRAGSTLTIVRGRGGTTAASHLAGATVVVAGQYHLRIERRGSTPSATTISEAAQVADPGLQDDGFDYSFVKDKDDVVNYVIFNCGTDLYGKAVEDVTYDLESYASERKEYYATEETADIFNNLWNKERDRSRSRFSPNSEGLPTAQFPASYPYVFEDGVSVANDEAFNDELRTRARVQGKAVADRLLTDSKNPRYGASFQMLFFNSFTPGQLVDTTFPSRAVVRKLRVAELRHGVTGTGIVLEEDAATATRTGA